MQNDYTYSLISQSSSDAESNFVTIWSIYKDKTYLNVLHISWFYALGFKKRANAALLIKLPCVYTTRLISGEFIPGTDGII